MRILNVSPRVTSCRMGGSQRRMEALLDRLEERHEVVQLCQPRLPERRIPGAPRERINRSLAAALLCEVGERAWTTAPVLAGAGLRLSGRRVLRELLSWADVTVVEFPWQLDRCARLAPDARLVLSAHNVEVEKFEAFADAAGARLTRGPWLGYIERMERAAVERADALVTVTEQDRHGLVERYGADPARCIVAPNGADLDALAPPTPPMRAEARRRLGLDGARPVVLFAGGDVTPNRRGLEWVREVARRCDGLSFLVVGPVGGRARREGNVVVAGHVPEFERCVHAADLSICPIEFGGGSKVKLIEAMAAGLPTVAFAESVHGTGARDGEHLLVADRSAESLERCLDRLVTNRALAGRIGAGARRYAAEHHDWDRIAERVEDLLVQLVQSPPTAPKRQPAAAGSAG